MNTQVITVDFNTPRALNLDDKVSLRDIYKELVMRGGLTGKDPFANWVKEKLSYYAENIDFFIVLEKSKSLNRNGKARASVAHEYYTSVQIAMEVLANGHGEIGHQMRRFMSGCVRLVNEAAATKQQLTNDDIQQLHKNSIRDVAVNYSTANGLSAHEIVGAYPEIFELAKKYHPKVLEKYGRASAAVSCLLKTFNLSNTKALSPITNQWRYIYNRQDIEAISLKIKKGEIR